MGQKLGINPWINIWISPKKTIRAIIAFREKINFFLLASIALLQKFLFFSVYFGLKFSWVYVFCFILVLISSPFLGALWFYFYSYLLHTTGKWLKGIASFSQICTVFSWSKVPLIIDIFMWFILLTFSAEHLFVHYSLGISFLFIHIIFFMTAFWSLILLIIGMQEVQKFSLLKTIINVFLSYLAFLLIAMAINFIYIFIFSLFN